MKDNTFKTFSLKFVNCPFSVMQKELENRVFRAYKSMHESPLEAALAEIDGWIGGHGPYTEDHKSYEFEVEMTLDPKDGGDRKLRFSVYTEPEITVEYFTELEEIEENEKTD